MVNPMPTSHWGFESYSFLASHWRRFIVLGLKFIILFASLLLDSHRIFSSLFHFHTHSSWTNHNLYASQSPMLYNNWLPHWTKPWQSNLGHNYPQEKRPENHNSTLLLMRHTGILYIVGTGSCVGKQLEDSGILRTCWLPVVPSKRMAYNVWPKVCLLIFHISEHGRTAFCAFRVERGNERNYLLATSVVRHMGILTQPQPLILLQRSPWLKRPPKGSMRPRLIERSARWSQCGCIPSIQPPARSCWRSLL